MAISCSRGYNYDRKPVRAGFAGRRQLKLAKGSPPGNSLAWDRVEVWKCLIIVVGKTTSQDEFERRDGRVCNYVTSSLAHSGMSKFIGFVESHSAR
jgi:hypothetical protein